MNDFDALLAELAPLAKAMKPDASADGDAKIKAAADEAGADVPEPESDEDEAAPNADADEGEGDEGALGKSFRVTMPDGSVQEAFDGTEVMKALRVEMAAVVVRADSLGTDLDAARSDLTKSLSVSSTMFGLVRSQGALIKSLQAQMATLAGTGTGRRASLTLHEKQDAAPAEPAAPDGSAVMAKAMTAYQAGTFVSSDIARLEAYAARGLPPPADLVARLPA